MMKAELRRDAFATNHSKRPTASLRWALRWLPRLLLPSVALSCGAAQYRADRDHARVVAPIAFAEGNTGKSPVAPKPDPVTATTDDAKATPPPKNKTRAQTPAPFSEQPGAALPDPKPLSTHHHYELEVLYDQGTLRVVSARPITTDKPRSTQRTMGRFAFELWIGQELIERVRFDFPLLGAEDVPQGDVIPLHAPVSLAARAEVSRSVLVPASERATRAHIVDRANGEVTPVEWPPLVAGHTTPVTPTAQPSTKPPGSSTPKPSGGDSPQPATL